MSLDVLNPISVTSLNNLDLCPDQVIGKTIKVHTEDNGIPDLDGVKVALIGLTENRNAFFPTSNYDLDSFRISFYKLYPGNWGFEIADLGNLPDGEIVTDTYFALTEICNELQKINIITVLIGGSHDMIYSVYLSLIHI